MSNLEKIYSRFEETNKKAELGGGPDRIAKQKKDGRLTARERIILFFDPGTFVELDG